MTNTQLLTIAAEVLEWAPTTRMTRGNAFTWTADSDHPHAVFVNALGPDLETHLYFARAYSVVLSARSSFAKITPDKLKKDNPKLSARFFAAVESNPVAFAEALKLLAL